MNKEELDKTLETMQNKLGKEQSSIIADDLGLLVTDNEKMNKDYSELMEKYEKSELRNQQLVEANSNLLRQVSAPANEFDSLKIGFNNYKTDKEVIDPIDIRTAFDEKGNFKR